MVDRRGWRLKIGVVVPSTNTIVQPDFDDLKPDGVTNHTARISIPDMAIRTDDDFDRMVRLSAAEQDAAVDRVMTAAPGCLVVGMSSLLVWDGLDAARERRRNLSERTGCPVTGGSFAVADALERLGLRRIAILSPYMPIADHHIRAFFVELGFQVEDFIGLKCPSPVAIAGITADTLTRALDEIDGPGVEALVQFGTNLHFMQQAGEEERRRGKPVLAINAVSYWHALRVSGLDDRVEGCGETLAGL